MHVTKIAETAILECRGEYGELLKIRVKLGQNQLKPGQSWFILRLDMDKNTVNREGIKDILAYKNKTPSMSILRTDYV